LPQRGPDAWATFSPCRRYRYSLGRRWADGPALAVIGHNPSTADESVDDPTIRRCIGFAKRDGFGSLLMLNLCAWRDTNPNALALLDDPVGPDNDRVIQEAVAGAGRVLAAWGGLAAQSTSQRVRGRPFAVAQLVTAATPLYALRIGKDGSPGHPLYIPSDAPMSVYREVRP
jgi:hypothetical protein